MISMNWVKDYVDLEGEDLKDLAVKITKAGINVEDVVTNHIDHLVIGEVKECVPHPDSDHLNICQVDVGEKELRQIVCGAPNVRKGIKVIVALPGAILPGDFEIKAGKIRGEKSDGMICALFELGLEEKTEETYAKGIEELKSDAPVGVDPLEYLGVEDTKYELDVHKHRNNDCYSHIGFAYEVGTIINKKVELPVSKYKESKEDINKYIKLEVKTDKCPFYLGKMVKNVKIGESPEWIKRRIIAAGMRPINNIVDISNFVMLEYGQPTHFFDADKLGKKVLVRNATPNEKITTLDGIKRVLTDKDLVITDGKVPTCIAGVMGGENTEVDENTKNIFIEAAIFDAVTTRNTSEKLDLKSEASIRYGKGLNYEYTFLAMDRCCSLLEEYASGEVLSSSVLHDKTDKSIKEVEFTTEEINNMLGIEISDKDMEVELKRLDFEYTKNKNKFKVIIPKRRLDIDPNVADMAEEIGRLYGYHNLKSSLPLVPNKEGVYKGDVGIRKSISKRLRNLGLNQTLTYTLTSPEDAKLFRYDNREQITLPSPLSVDKSVIRTSIIPSLLNVYRYNKARKVENVLLYEIGKTYDVNYEEISKVTILMSGNYIDNEWSNTRIECDFYTLKGVIENVLDYLGFKNRYSFEKSEIADLHPGMSAKILVDRNEIGVIGRVHPKLTKDEIYVAEFNMTYLYEAKVKPLKYKEASKYPEIRKDVAFIVDKEITNEEITTVIRKAGGRLLSSIDIFDIYDMGKKKSMAYKLIFKDDSRTLSDEEVMKVFDNIIDKVKTDLKASLRDN
ncbi:MAG: phenylalanine--tRNA ligase subunit beta [Bacilli bacterium]|nr:phenylalanine--tRNA ligase subunit beta [Bacilli bacterium]